VKRYEESFRKDAVETLIKSGRPLKRLARELGVSIQALRNWRDAYLGKAEGQKPAEVPAVRQAYDELRELRAENAVLKRQRDILKKALSILSDPPGGGMR
jgi:transposase